MAEHIPGPYEVEAPDVDSVDIRLGRPVPDYPNPYVATVWIDEDIPLLKEQAVATAMLFAAADDLLWACECVARCIQDEIPICRGSGYHRQLMKAINKAKGKVSDESNRRTNPLSG